MGVLWLLYNDFAFFHPLITSKDVITSELEFCDCKANKH